jgi:signal transduction histidine kinase
MKPYLYRRFLQPHSLDLDTRRREFILNVLLFGLGVLAFAAILPGAAYLAEGRITNGLSSVFSSVTFLLIVIGLWYLVRRGHYYLGSYTLLVLIGVAYLWLSWRWSFELPAGLLLFAVMLLVAGVLLAARSALRFAALVIAVAFIIASLQVAGTLHPDTAWLHQPIILGDAIGYTIIFCIISLVSWVANSEIDRSLVRARQSEVALAAERDSLEIKVAARTKDLEKIQMVRLMELQRFAEFGRFSANLLHEVGNPLTAASLNLEQVSHGSHSKLVSQAYKSLQHLERYLAAARKQLKGQAELGAFSVHKELAQLLDILLPNARQKGVRLELKEDGRYRLYGDAVKFNQLLSNLIHNAIEAYEEPAGGKPVIITVAKQNSRVIIAIQDKGHGIPRQALPHIFEPFYSTKPESSRSMGIGLAMVKQFVEQDFQGAITVTSSPNRGTRFTVTLANQQPAKP